MLHTKSTTVFAAHVATTANNVNAAGGMTFNKKGEFVVAGVVCGDLLNVVLQDVNCMAGAWDTNAYIDQLAEDEIEGCDWNEFMTAVALCLELDIPTASY